MTHTTQFVDGKPGKIIVSVDEFYFEQLKRKLWKIAETFFIIHFKFHYFNSTHAMVGCTYPQLDTVLRVWTTRRFRVITSLGTNTSAVPGALYQGSGSPEACL